MNDKTILEQAVEITTGDRRRDYGRPLTNHLRIAILWTMTIQEKLPEGVVITPADVVRMMIGTKQAREMNTPKFDNMLDTVGYSACLDDMYRQLIELGIADDYDDAMRKMRDVNLVIMQSWLGMAIRYDKEAREDGRT